jgi:tetratricopeptide (TPR) repeat protein
MAADLRTEELPACPYQGLEPFTEADQAYFFGREVEQETIGATLMTSALTVFFGPSGVGKTSVLRAGVIPFVELQPAVTVVLFRTWQHDDFEKDLKQEIAEAVFRRSARRIDAGQPLDVCLIAASEVTDGTIAVIFDQFEEYLLYHPAHSERGARFDRELARAVNRDSLDANFLISLREDALAGLDRFQPYIPDLLNNTIRLDHLDEEGARRAIRSPLERYNKVLSAKGLPEPAWHAETTLLDEMIEDVRVDKHRQDQKGKGRIVDADPIRRVVTPFLQMVLVKLWNTERAAGSHELRTATLRALGGADTIVRGHVERVMATLGPAEQVIATSMIEHLVTPSGSKIAHTAGDLAAFAASPPVAVQNLLEKLGDKDRRLLRSTAPTAGQGQTRYEIFHDVLSDALLAWRTQFLLAKEAAAQEQERLAKQRRDRKVFLQRAGIVAGAVLLVLAGIILVLAREARAKARVAEANANLVKLQQDLAASEQKQTTVLESAAATSRDITILRQLLDQYRKIGNVDGEVTTLVRLGDATMDAGKFGEASRHYSDALSKAKDRSVQADILLRQARLLNSLGQPAPAIGKASFAVTAAAGTRTEADISAGAGDVYVKAGEYSLAVKEFGRAANLYGEKAPQRRAEMLVNQAQALRDVTQTTNALTLLREAAKIFRDTGAGDRAAITSLAIDAREEAQLRAAEEEAQRLRSQRELTSISATATQSPGKACAAKQLNGIWTEVDRKTRKATTLSWTFKTSGDNNQTLLAERRDGAVRGAFTFDNDRFYGVLEWTKGDRWENVQFHLPKESDSCRYMETNQAFTFVAARTIGLQPKVAALADDLIRRAAEQGLEIRVLRGYVSEEEQADLYARGRTRAKGGTSHNRGLAFDVYIFRDGKPDMEPPKADREKIGAIGESLGLSWGGRYKSPDYTHFYLADSAEPEVSDAGGAV